MKSLLSTFGRTMFKKDKDLDQRTCNVIKNKDLKKLKNDLLKQFPVSSTPSSPSGITDDLMTLIFPSKCSITCTKLTSRTLVYSVDSIPCFFDVHGRCDLYPTIFTLWKIPTLLPQVVIHPPVSTYILRGADLMTPGIYTIDSSIQKGEKVSIRVRNNRCSFAVGVSELDDTPESTHLQGMATRVVHMFGDALWKTASGQISVPNEGFSSLKVVTGDGSQCDHRSDEETEAHSECESDDENCDDNDEDYDKGSVGRERSDVIDCVDVEETLYGDSPSVETHSELDKKVVDEVLLLHLLRCLKYIVRDSSLPVLVSSLWGTIKKSVTVRKIDVTSRDSDNTSHLPSPLSPGVDLDIKHSSFGKVSKFFQFVAESEGVFVLEEVSSGVDAVVKVHRQHDLFKIWKSTIAVEDPDLFRNDMVNNPHSKGAVQDHHGDGSVAFSSLKASDIIAKVEIGPNVRIVDIYKLTKDLRGEFSGLASEGGPDKYYTGSEVQQLLHEYTKALNLQSPSVKSDLIIPSTNFFNKLLQREVSKVKTSNKQFSEGLKSTKESEGVGDDGNGDGENDRGVDMEEVDEWDENIDREVLGDRPGGRVSAPEDPLAQYTVVAGVVLSATLSGTSSGDSNLNSPISSTSTNSSRRSNVPGGWGVATGEKWKPIELPKARKENLSTTKKESLSSSSSNRVHQQHSHKAKSSRQNSKSEEVESSEPLSIAKEMFMKVLKSRLTRYHAVVFPSGDCSVAAGSPPNILVEVEMRKGNKVITKVSGLEPFGFDIPQTAKKFQRKFACSTTVAVSPGKDNSKQEIVLQGHWADELESYLVDAFGMQKRFLERRISGKIKPKKR